MTVPNFSMDDTLQVYSPNQKAKRELMVNKKNKAPFCDNISNFALVTGGIAHDLNNTLVAIVGYSELLCELFIDKLNDEDIESAKEARDAIKNGSIKATNIVKYLKTLSNKYYRESDGNLISRDIREVLYKIKENKYWNQKLFKLRFVGSNKIPCIGFPEPIIALILDEIIMNSYKISLKHNKPVTLTIYFKYFTNESLLKIVGKDTGPGFDKKTLENTSSKENFSGLYIISQIANRLGGWMMIDNDKKGGARIELAIKV